eukprot:TRINITY_DN4345_c0_g2_i1.p1 TRINITY_DN4345_c0_g2~~TRINITY_DN4345_c0_g2_i1.p1  ORF type:complete len:350 (+),score=37.91 TRINITY_DN4345_c0_g2_i1:79-1128(+)
MSGNAALERRAQAVLDRCFRNVGRHTAREGFHNTMRIALVHEFGPNTLTECTSGLWEVTVDGVVIYVSVRMEADNAELQKRVSTAYHNVKDLIHKQRLYGHSQEAQLEAILDAFPDGPDSLTERRYRDDWDWDDDCDLCECCERPLYMDCLHRVHHCRVVATFRCKRCHKRFTSQRGRYLPEEDRVLTQYCTCGDKRPPDCTFWELLTEGAREKLEAKRQRRDENRLRNPQGFARGSGRGRGAPAESLGVRVAPCGVPFKVPFPIPDVDQQRLPPAVPDPDRQPNRHIHDSCDGCIKYGDCLGVFADPDWVLLSLEALGFNLQQTGVNGGVAFQTGEGVVRLVGHVTVM